MAAKKRRLSIKLTQEDFDAIHHQAAQSNRNLTDYVTQCCLGQQIVVIPGMAEVLRQQAAIGRNLNQIATLANMGRLNAINLTTTQAALGDVSEALRLILERGRWRK